MQHVLASNGGLLQEKYSCVSLSLFVQVLNPVNDDYLEYADADYAALYVDHIMIQKNCHQDYCCQVCGGSNRLQGRQHAASVGQKAKDGPRRGGPAVNKHYHHHHLYHHTTMSKVAYILVY